MYFQWQFNFSKRRNDKEYKKLFQNKHWNDKYGKKDAHNDATCRNLFKC